MTTPTLTLNLERDPLMREGVTFRETVPAGITEVRIGREAPLPGEVGDNVQFYYIPWGTVSAVHLIIRLEADRWVLYDPRSTNGTFWLEGSVPPRKLENGVPYVLEDGARTGWPPEGSSTSPSASRKAPLPRLRGFIIRFTTNEEPKEASSFISSQPSPQHLSDERSPSSCPHRDSTRSREYCLCLIQGANRRHICHLAPCRPSQGSTRALLGAAQYAAL